MSNRDAYIGILIEKTTEEIAAIVRGGKGSGHHGHAGRPGEVGGSAPSGGDVKAGDYLTKPFGKVEQSAMKEAAHNWSQTRPWERSERDFREGKVPFFTFDADGKWAAAWRRDHIEVRPRFFEYDEFNRVCVLYHEIGHDVANKLLHPDVQYEIFDALEHFREPYGEEKDKPLSVHSVYHNFVGSNRGDNKRPNEFIADIYMDMILGGEAHWEEGGNYGKPYVLVREMAERLGWPSTPLWKINVTKDEDGTEHFGIIERGGVGSGHHDHAGRPGEVGGSQPSDGLRRPDTIGPDWHNDPEVISKVKEYFDAHENLEEVSLFKFTRGFIAPDGTLYQMEPASDFHASIMSGAMRNAGITNADLMEKYGNLKLWGTFNSREVRKIGYIDTAITRTGEFNELRLSLVTPIRGAARKTILDLWATLPEDNRLITADINRLEAYDIYGSVPKKFVRNQIAHDERKFTALTGIVLRGGKGSGHHGHAGRQGEVGGSLPSGSTGANKTVSKEFARVLRKVPKQWREGIALNYLVEGDRSTHRPGSLEINIVESDVVGITRGRNLNNQRVALKGYSVQHELVFNTPEKMTAHLAEQYIAHEIGHVLRDRMSAQQRKRLGSLAKRFSKHLDSMVVNEYRAYLEDTTDDFFYRVRERRLTTEISTEVIRLYLTDQGRFEKLPKTLRKEVESIFGGSPNTESIMRGGVGSGHHGHEGRPGEVGGSAPSGDGRQVREYKHQGMRGKIFNEDELQEKYKMIEEHWGLTAATNINSRRASWMMPDGRVTVSLEEHDDLVNSFGEWPSLMASGFVRVTTSGISPMRPKAFVNFQFDIRALTSVTRQAMSDIFWSMNYIGGRYEGKPTLIVDYYDEDGTARSPENRIGGCHLTTDEFKRQMGWRIDKSMTMRGGKGSGHHDHQGRRGKVGGSLPKYAPDPYDLDEKIGEYKYIVQGMPEFKPYFKALKQQKKRILERESGKFSASRQLRGINKRRKQIAKRTPKLQERLDLISGEGVFWGEGELDQERIDLREEILTLRDEDRGLQAEITIIQSLTQRGGVGSGHHGHAGRPGEVGGSAPSGEFTGISPNLLPLARVARKYDNFESFSYDYSMNNVTGIAFHLTNEKDFFIDPEKGPRDMSSLGTGRMTPGAFMVTTDIENWAATIGERPYVAVVDLSDLDFGTDYSDATRGFGQEFYISNPSEAKVITIIPLDEAVKFSEYLYHQGGLPESKEELRDIWKWAQTQPVLRGGPGSGHHGHAGRPGQVGGSRPSGGSNISDFLKVPQTPLWEPVNRAFAAIEKVHGVNPLKSLRVFRSKSKRRRGSYYTYWTPMGIVPEKMGIRLGEQDDKSRALTTAHETGHFLDHTMFGSVLYFTSEDMIDRQAESGKTDAVLDLISDNHDEARAYQKWWKAITSTQEYLNMETYPTGVMHIDENGNFVEGRKVGATHYKYTPALLNSWRQPGEYFARSYSQYIATRSGDAWMDNELESELQMSRRGGAPTQWEEESFKPIAKAFDELFDSVGLLR